MRMRVDFIRRTVRRPPSMRDPDRPADGRLVHGNLEFGDLARCFARLETLPVERGNASRVITAILQTLESLDQHRHSGFRSNVSDNSTHSPILDLSYGAHCGGRVQSVQWFPRTPYQLARASLRGRLGNHTHDGLGTRRPHMQPAIRPGKPKSILSVYPCVRESIT